MTSLESLLGSNQSGVAPGESGFLRDRERTRRTQRKIATCDLSVDQIDLFRPTHLLCAMTSLESLLGSSQSGVDLGEAEFLRTKERTYKVSLSYYYDLASQFEALLSSSHRVNRPVYTLGKTLDEQHMDNDHEGPNFNCNLCGKINMNDNEEGVQFEETEIDLSEVLAVPGSIAPDNGSTLDITLDVEFSGESQVTITSIVNMLKTATDADEFHPPDIQASNEMTQGFEEKESKVRLFKERTKKNERKEPKHHITLDVEFSAEALESNETDRTTEVSFYKTNLKEFSAEALVRLMMLINLIQKISKKMDRTQGADTVKTLEERSMTVDLAEALAQGSIAAPDNGSTLDINLDVEFSAESQVNITSIVHMLKNARDADEFHTPDIQASNEMDRTTHGFEEKESKVRLPFKERTEKNERNDEKSNEDRLEKTMEDAELEKGFEEKQNEEGVQEESKSSEETNKDKVCTDLHWRTAAKNDLIVSVLLFKHKIWYGNVCTGNKTDENGQKNRHKNTRCTWEPGIIWME